MKRSNHMAVAMSETGCPCGLGESYEVCCLAVKQAGAETPEQLMRSRYSAFYYSDVDYLLETTHESLLEPGLRRELKQACGEETWLSLRIIDSPKATKEQGFVEFVAYCKNGGSVGELHERSKFLKVDGKWLYHSGVVLPHYKIGVNEPCWCGSGKKLKKCHLV